jgi:hypothetical protein
VEEWLLFTPPFYALSGTLSPPEADIVIRVHSCSFVDDLCDLCVLCGHCFWLRHQPHIRGHIKGVCPASVTSVTFCSIVSCLVAALLRWVIRG